MRTLVRWFITTALDRLVCLPDALGLICDDVHGMRKDVANGQETFFDRLLAARQIDNE